MGDIESGSEIGTGENRSVFYDRAIAYFAAAFKTAAPRDQRVRLNFHTSANVCRCYQAGAVYGDVALGGPMRPEDVADCIMFALTRPPNVNVDELVVMALAQTSGANILRD